MDFVSGANSKPLTATIWVALRLMWLILLILGSPDRGTGTGHDSRFVAADPGYRPRPSDVVSWRW